MVILFLIIYMEVMYKFRGRKCMSLYQLRQINKLQKFNRDFIRKSNNNIIAVIQK